MNGAGWTDDEIARSQAILAKHTRVGDAAAEISASVRRCSKDNLGKAFQWRKLSTPSAYLLRPAAIPVVAAVKADTEPYTGAPPPDYEEDEKTERVDIGGSLDGNRYLIIPDQHIPYHEESVTQQMLRVARFLRPTHVIVGGDYADFYAVSSHDKSPARASRLADELAVVAEKMTELEGAIGDAHRHFIMGNHEWRLERMISKQAPALHGLVGMRACEVLDLQSRGWTHTEYGREHLVGKTRMSHDYGDAGMRALALALNATRSDTIIFHTHRVGSHYMEDPATGETISANSFGWGGDYEPIDYFHRVKAMRAWGWGVGVGFGRADGTMRRECVRLGPGRILKVDGQRA